MDTISLHQAGFDCAVASLDDLALGYATALFLREETGPHSLVNRAGSNPSIVDGLEVPLLSVPEPSKSLQGGGSATIASLAASGAPGANAGSGTQTTFATSSLPVSYKIAANPSSGPVKPGSQIALSSPQLASLPGAHYEVATLTTYEQILNLSAPFLPLEDPLLFEPGVLAYAVRIASDRGTTPHTVFGFYETAEPDEGEGDQGDDPPGGDRLRTTPETSLPAEIGLRRQPLRRRRAASRQRTRRRRHRRRAGPPDAHQSAGHHRRWRGTDRRPRADGRGKPVLHGARTMREEAERRLPSKMTRHCADRAISNPQPSSAGSIERRMKA